MEYANQFDYLREKNKAKQFKYVSKRKKVRTQSLKKNMEI